ncbi:MAG: T9SS type A sorting domain-containing protein [bacterium]|nr:MAG: T9SS type A sorting domain-containing protein [bacterium]
MRHKWIMTGVVLTCLLLLSSSALAVWITDGNAICTASGNQQYPAVVSDGLGGAIIAWHDMRAGHWDIYAQRVNGMGNNLWIADGIAICMAPGNQEYPGICSDGAGGAIITWYDHRGSDYDIYAQRVDASGNVLWTVNGVSVCTAPGNQGYPPWIYYKGYRIIVPDGSGGAIISWDDERAGHHDIYAQRVDALGNALWTTNGVAVCTAAGHQYSPVLIGDGSGGAIITWYSGWHSSSGTDIYAQRVNASGTPMWTTNGVAICTAPNYQCYPDIVSDGAGGAIMAWIDGRVGGYYEDNIYAQRINSSGTVVWIPNGIGIGTAPGDDGWPQLLPDGLGGAFIAWGDGRPGASGIYVQRVDAMGSPYWAANGVGLAPTTTHGQSNYGIVSNGVGGAILAWCQYPFGQSIHDVYAQRIDASGVLKWSVGGVVISAAPNLQVTNKSAGVVSDGSGGAVIAWWDNRSGSDYDIYALRIDQYGDIFAPGFALDIKPGSCPNPFNIKDKPNEGGNGKGQKDDYAIERKTGGVLPAAIVGSEDADVNDIDVSTILLEGISPLRSNYEDVTRPVENGGYCACTDEGPDGYLDLTLKFSRNELSEILGPLEHGVIVELMITFALMDGTPIEASDCIKIVGRRPEGPKIEEIEVVQLGNAVPNPFNPLTRIHYFVPDESVVTLEIFDTSGRLIVRLVDNERMIRGLHAVEWRGVDKHGRAVGSGVYYYRLKVGNETMSKKMVLLR